MTSPLQIELKAVNKYYGNFHALKNIDLAVPSGTFVALVGPSGCGKSTLLRSLAGLEETSGGKMEIAGVDVTDMPPRKRDVAMVFQSYALYPHMTVAQNLTYSLRIQKVAKAELRAAAEKVAASIGLTELLDRYPRELSGGQRQRVAMGRAIIRNPKVFLFDEPLSNLDASLRVQMRKEIRALHDRLGATTVYVTHDQIEAMTMADHVVVLRAGVIEQQASPMTLYERPTSKFVAGFIGSPAMNFIEGKICDNGTSVMLEMAGAPKLDIVQKVTPNMPVTVGIRPEHIRVAPSEECDFSLPVTLIETTGTMSYVSLGTAPELSLMLTDRTVFSVGDNIGLVVDKARIHLFDPKTEQAIT
ncbi:MAG: sn-glycerol-3-phosphate ABC transporter ATP-binding protein UgpC [Rhodobacteraceae bacterium]|nr:sn-glycerol-3-phosphate ABC transporter ATP-binding protein UgpC [Paracoccaceae bacterium]PHR53859.1 MAG: glycerol-3-phosphate ABC transporter ATP-binding protein [Robiginitomaculum sp.]